MPVFSYEVGAIFSIEDRGSATLQRLGEGFEALDATILSAQERMAAFGKGEGLFGGITAGMETINTLFTTMVERAVAAGEAMETAFRRGAEAAAAEARAVDGLAEAMNRAANASERMRRGGGMGGGARGRRAGAAAGAAEEAAEDFDEGDYERLPTRRGFGPVVPAFGGGGGRSGGGGRIGGPGADFIEGEFEEIEQLRLAGPASGRGLTGGSGPGAGSFRGFSGYGGAGPGGGPPGRPFYPVNAPGGGGGGGGGGMGGGHTGAILEGVALYEAMKAGASEEQSIDIALLRGFHIDPRTATDEQKQYLRTLARNAAQGTSFSEREVAGGEEVLAAPLGFMGDEGMRKFGGVFEVAAKASEAAKQLHFGTFEGSLKGAVEFAHQMQMYDPAGLTKGMNLLGAITESLPHGDMEREALVMSYAIPQARALGADPETAMEGVGFLQRAGLRNTVAATTLRQMLIGQLKTGGPVNAHLESQRHALQHDMRELENSLALKPGALGQAGGTKKGNEHVKALEDLGLINHAGKLQDLNAAGGIDLNRMFELMAVAQKKMSPIDFGKAMFNAFGVRGQTGGEIIGEALPLFNKYKETVRGTAPLDEQLRMISGSSSQLTGQAVARTADLGNAIGTTLLPSLKAFDDAVIAATGFLRGLVGDHPAATATVVGGAVAASVVGGVMTARALPHWIRSMFAEGSAERGVEAVRGIGPRIGGAMRGLGGLGLLGITAEAGHSLLESGTSAVMGGIFGPGAWEKGQRDLSQEAPSWWPTWLGGRKEMPPQPNTARVGPRADLLGDGTSRAAAAPQQVHIAVTVNNTMNGVADEGTFQNLLHKLTGAIKGALERTATDPHGPDMSAYVYPGLP